MEVYSVFFLIISILVLFFRTLINNNNYFFIAEFLLITISGLFAYPWKEHITAWDTFVAFGGGATLALAFLALVGYLDYIRQEDVIAIKFNVIENENILESKDTGVGVLRKNCTRQEIQGILGILADIDRYNIEFIKNKKLLKILDEVQTTDKKEIIIDIQKNEAWQFSKILDKKYTKPPKEDIVTLPELKQQLNRIENLIKNNKPQK